MDTTTNAVCLLTGGFLLVAMDQIPRIVRPEPQVFVGGLVRVYGSGVCEGGGGGQVTTW